MDPVSIYQADILKITDRISYFMTAHFCYYGIVNSDNYKIVIGPASQVPNSTPTLRDLAMQLDIPGDDTDDFIIAMQNITHIPLESLMQILCLLNYILNDEKRFLHDVFIDDAIQKQFIESMNKHNAEMFFSNDTNQSPRSFLLPEFPSHSQTPVLSKACRKISSDSQSAYPPASYRK